MTTVYPGALDSLPRPSSGTNMDDPGFEGDLVIDNISDAIEALEAKLGTGAAIALARLAAGSAGLVRSDGTVITAGNKVNRADVTEGQLPSLIGTSGVLVAPLAYMDFNGIPQTFTSLELRIAGASTAAALNEQVMLRMNSEATPGYFSEILIAQGATAAAAELLSGTAQIVGLVPGATASPAGWPGVATAWFHGYTSTLMKGVLSIYHVRWATASLSAYTQVVGGSMTYGAAITSLRVYCSTGSWAAGSIISLYGHP